MYMFQVYNKRCDQCLFSDVKIVDEERAQEIISHCSKRGTYFICHKSSIHNNGNVCCKGFWDGFKDNIAHLQIAQCYELVEFIDLPKDKV
jgi:hypothetical protein